MLAKEDDIATNLIELNDVKAEPIRACDLHYSKVFITDLLSYIVTITATNATVIVFNESDYCMIGFGIDNADYFPLKLIL